MQNLKVIAFDADDTLWINEPFFRDAEAEFCALLEEYVSFDEANKALFKMEMANLPLYGYGIKGFVLSLIEFAIKISEGKVSQVIIEKALAIGKDMLQKPVDLLPGVVQTLEALQGHYRLIVCTKGDLLDQERKLEKSGLLDYFHQTEIVSNKNEVQYERMLQHLDVQADEFMMIGNSLKSDVLPVLNIGAWGVHVPFQMTWEHETVKHAVEGERFRAFNQLNEVIDFLSK